MYWATTNHLNAQRLSSFMSWHPQRSLVILGPKFTQENQLTTSLILFHHPEKHPKKIINAFTPLLEKQKLREFKILLAIFKAADGCASANEKRYGRESVASPEFTQNLLDQKLTKFDLDGVLNICQAVQAAYQAIEKLNLGFGTTPIPSEFNKEFH
jgi:hypothetical protein